MVPVVLAAVTLVTLAIRPALTAEVTYFDVPRGAHPHDVAPAPDGSVWYTAQSQGAIGILNPKTGRANQISLGKRFGASWRYRRSGSRSMDYRRRSKRHRAV